MRHLIIGLTVACLTATFAGAATVTSMTGASSPAGQGWTAQSGVLSGGTVSDLGETAWRMTGNGCCGYWSSALTSQQWTDAFTLGWTFRGLARVSSGTNSSGVGYFMLDTPLTYNRYDIIFGFDGVNGFAGLSAHTDSANPLLKYTFSDNLYHLLEMRYDPGTQSASLYVDGVLRLSGYTGHQMFRENHGPSFGVSGNTVQANFVSVAFDINYPAPPPAGTDTPEPSAAWLLAGGLLLLVLRRR